MKKKFNLKNKSLLITGGTGSLGKALTKELLLKNYGLKKIIILSRDEQKHFQMSQEFPQEKYKQLRYFIGDVRDKDRLIRAFQNVDIVVHAAAMKHVHLAEYNPDECIKTNIEGARNVVDASLICKVKRIVALSTDKACAPINLYGATKLTSDKLFISANNLKGNLDIRFSVVRYGNVMGSNGSVIPFFIKKKNNNEIFPITHPEMTRFNISLKEGVNMVLNACVNAWGGEIFIPKIPSYKILDVVNAIDSKAKTKIVGVRPGEKIHEEMITSSDSYNTYDLGNYYAIIPQVPKWNLNEFLKFHNASKVSEGFSYNSKDNLEWETISSLRNLIKKNVDKNF